MALAEEFERTGNWLFRRRSYLPLAMLALCLLAMRTYRYPGGREDWRHVWELTCLLVSFFGLGIRIVTIGHTPRGTSGRNTRSQVAEALNTTGIYSLTRNPLYLGNFFMWLGIVLVPLSWWLAVLYVLVFWLYYERIIFAEEAFLRRKFGDVYLAWADVTPAFLPRLRRFHKADLSFSWKNALKREYNGFFAVIVVMFVLDLVGTWAAERRLAFPRGWIWALGLGFIIWTALRTLRKRTSVLDVEGR